MWFLYLVLKSVFCESDVCFRSVFALRVTVAWQITDVWRQFRPLSGQVFFCRQLQVLLSFVFVLFAMSSMSWSEFKTRLLWLSMIWLVLFMQCFG